MHLQLEYSTDYTPSAPVLEVKLYSSGRRRITKIVQALVDTGADNTIMPLELLQAIKAPRVTKRPMRGVMGHVTEVGIYSVTLEVAGELIRGAWVAGVPQRLEEPIIGRDVLRRLVITLNGPDETLEIQETSE